MCDRARLTLLVLYLVASTGCNFMAKTALNALRSGLHQQADENQSPSIQFSNEGQRDRYKAGFQEQRRQGEFLRELQS